MSVHPIVQVLSTCLLLLGLGLYLNAPVYASAHSAPHKGQAKKQTIHSLGHSAKDIEPQQTKLHEQAKSSFFDAIVRAFKWLFLGVLVVLALCIGIAVVLLGALLYLDASQKDKPNLRGLGSFVVILGLIVGILPLGFWEELKDWLNL